MSNARRNPKEEARYKKEVMIRADWCCSGMRTIIEYRLVTVGQSQLYMTTEDGLY